MQVFKSSLSETVDSVNESTFFGRKSNAATRLEVARFIAARQGLPGSYAQMFAGFDDERRRGIRLFTGERITCASARHILGEEACRALRQLDARDKAVRLALERADSAMTQRLRDLENKQAGAGWFCCGKCSVGMWRNLLSGGLDRQAERLHDGVRILRKHRDDDGGWKRFPFWYTVLALVEMNEKAARSEIEHASQVLERAIKQRSSASAFATRRTALAERALDRV
jgi:hypothetical protein